MLLVFSHEGPEGADTENWLTYCCRWGLAAVVRTLVQFVGVLAHAPARTETVPSAARRNSAIALVVVPPATLSFSNLVALLVVRDLPPCGIPSLSFSSSAWICFLIFNSLSGKLLLVPADSRLALLLHHLHPLPTSFSHLRPFRPVLSSPSSVHVGFLFASISPFPCTSCCLFL